MTSTIWCWDEKCLASIFFFFEDTGVLEELDFFEPQWQIRRQKLLPEVGLFLGRLPWRRGKRFNLC